MKSTNTFQILCLTILDNLKYQTYILTVRFAYDARYNNDA